MTHSIRLVKFFLPALLIVFMGLQCVQFARENGQTSDEPFYFALGYSGLVHHDYTFQPEHPLLMPQIGALALLNLKLDFPQADRVYLEDGKTPDTTKTGLKFLYQKGNDADRMLFYARIPILLITLALGILLTLWAYELFGFLGSMISLTLCSFCPNMIAHGSLFTIDSGVTVFFFATFYFFYRFFKTGKNQWIILAALFAGLCAGSKMSGMIVLPAAAFLLFAYIFIQPLNVTPDSILGQSRWIHGLAWVLLILSLGHTVSFVLVAPVCLPILLNSNLMKQRIKLSAALAVVIYLIAIVLAYYLRGKNPSSLSNGLMLWTVLWAAAWFVKIRLQNNQHYQHAFHVFGLLCLGVYAMTILIYLDLPQTLIRFKAFNHFILTLKNSISHSGGTHKVCVDGSFISCDYKYFLQVMLIKTPVTSLVYAGLGLLSLPFIKISRFDKLILTAPPLTFLLVASFANKINIGLRHVLPVYPFLYLIAGSLGSIIKRISQSYLRIICYLVVLLSLIYYAFNSLHNFPNHLSYFNEWVGSTSQGAKLTADSNLVWGQDNGRLAEWAKKNQVPLMRVASRFQNDLEYKYYGMAWEVMIEQDYISPQPGYYAIDLEIMAGLPKQSLFKKISPVGKAGETILIFKVAQANDSILRPGHAT